MMKFSAGKVEHHDVWFNWKREDPAGADHRQVPRRPLRHLRLHHPHHGGQYNIQNLDCNCSVHIRNHLLVQGNVGEDIESVVGKLLQVGIQIQIQMK